MNHLSLNSIVLEETESSETDETDTQDIEEVLTATCTIGVDTPIKIETVIEISNTKAKKTKQYTEKQRKDKYSYTTADKKHVTFVDEEPVIFNAERDGQNSPKEENTGVTDKETITGTEEKLSEQADKGTKETENTKKPQYKVRFQMHVGSDSPKEPKKSLFAIVLGWFGKYI